MSFVDPKKDMAKSLALACRKLVGREFEFELDEETRGTFLVKQSWIDMLHYYNPIEYQGDIWQQCADIPWGQGFHTILYYNGSTRLIAIHDILCDTSKIAHEYEC